MLYGLSLHLSSTPCQAVCTCLLRAGLSLLEHGCVDLHKETVFTALQLKPDNIVFVCVCVLERKCFETTRKQSFIPLTH